VQVRLTRTGARVRLSVSDTGRGIRAEFLPHIFERFRQADSTSTRGQAGLGLGLAIARHIVDLHQGSIHATSDGEGKGATFTVVLPAPTEVETARLEGAGGPEGAGEALEPLDGVRVLVVDDDTTALDLVTVVLRQQGAEVTACRTVDEALATARRRCPDVVVCDIAMPGRDGFSLIRTLRSWSSGDGGTVPAVALTAYARREDREQALTEGFQMHLTKPVEPRELVGAVARLGRGWRADANVESPPRSATG
jgi:CheY-like chemotaxis protein